MRKTAILAAFIGALTGCTTYYTKPAVPRAQFDQDVLACETENRHVVLNVAESIARTEHVVVPTRELDRERFTQCMRDRGYNVSVGN